MALAVAVKLVGAQSPQGVQVAVSGFTAGDTYTVTAHWTGGSYTVRGADSVIGVGTQILLNDVATPINKAITYTATHDVDGAAASSAPITVPFGSAVAVCSLDGLTATSVQRVLDNGAPRELQMRSQFYRIPGRARPAVRFDVPGGETGQLVIDTLGAQTDALRSILMQGGLMLVRNDGSLRDLDPTFFALVVATPSVLPGVDNERRWTIDFEFVDDPQADAFVPVATWDDFDSVYSASTWTAFDAEWAGSTWDAFDREDWSTR